MAKAREKREGTIEKVNATIKLKPKVEKAELRIGKKGVLAKRAAMDRKAREIDAGVQAQSKENEEAVAKIGTGVREVQGKIKDKVAEIGSAVDAQAKENEEAVAKIGTGVRELQNATKEYINDFYYG